MRNYLAVAAVVSIWGIFGGVVLYMYLVTPY